MKSRVLSILAASLLLGSTVDNSVIAQGGLAACTEISDAAERLACYDEAAENTSNLPVVRLPRSTRPPNPEADSATTGNSAEARPDDFGLEEERERQRQQAMPQSRTLRVIAARHNDFTGWTIEFENGSVWKQVGTDDYDIEVGASYTINRRTFNSYLLSNPDNNRKIRVTRVE